MYSPCIQVSRRLGREAPPMYSQVSRRLGREADAAAGSRDGVPELCQGAAPCQGAALLPGSCSGATWIMQWVIMIHYMSAGPLPSQRMGALDVDVH